MGKIGCTIYNQDSRNMHHLPDNSVHCAVTSPPYFGLRSYEGGNIVWDGDPDCEHEWGDDIVRRDRGAAKGSSAQVGNQINEVSGVSTEQGSFCSLCGAWRGQLGSEPTPKLYIEHLVSICREVKRVLRKDGVFWLNIGDSWVANWRGSGSYNAPAKQLSNRGTVEFMGQQTKHPYKPLDMVLVPEYLVLMLRADGWYVRSIIVWNKPNAMPESVNGWRWERHRVMICSQCHSLDSFNRKRVCKVCGHNRGEPMSDPERTGRRGNNPELSNRNFLPIETGYTDCSGCSKCRSNNGYVLRKGSWRPTDSYEFILMLTKSSSYYCDKEAVKELYEEPLNSGRNLRSVWTFPTTSYSGAHFAVFPETLPTVCIKASTPEVGVCATCGAPWARMIESSNESRTRLTGEGQDSDRGRRGRTGETSSRTVGWMPTCDCEDDRQVPATVLDPFVGVGTTLLAALKLGRSAVGYEISEKYCALAEVRSGSRRGGKE